MIGLIGVWAVVGLLFFFTCGDRVFFKNMGEVKFLSLAFLFGPFVFLAFVFMTIVDWLFRKI